MYLAKDSERKISVCGRRGYLAIIHISNRLDSKVDELGDNSNPFGGWGSHGNLLRDSLKIESKRPGIRFQARLRHIPHVLVNPSVVSGRGELGHDKVVIVTGRAKPCVEDIQYNLPEAGLVRMGKPVPGDFFFPQ